MKHLKKFNEELTTRFPQYKKGEIVVFAIDHDIDADFVNSITKRLGYRCLGEIYDTGFIIEVPKGEEVKVGKQLVDKYPEFFRSYDRLDVNNNEIYKEIKNYLIDGKYIFHYTLTEHLEDILEEGLIPRKNPNSYYKDGSKGVFLTTSQSLYKANLPQSLMDVMDEYYEDEENYDNKPLVRLWIDVTKLDLSKLTWDDDYILNRYGWNKAVNDKEKVIESLDLWGSVSYLDTIPKNVIVKYDFDYSN